VEDKGEQENSGKNPRYGVVLLFAMVSAVFLFVSQNLINR
jgi:hypothetical protein